MRGPLGILVTAAALLLSAACGSSSSPDKSATGSTSGGPPDKVNVGVIAIVDVAPIYLGKQKGFFSKRNIDLTLTTAQGGAAIVPAVASGQYQFGFSNVVSLLLAGSNGLPLKMVCNGVASTGTAGSDYGAVMVKNDSPIRTAADLVGRKVAVNTLKNIGDTTTREAVRKAGGDPAKVNFVEMPFPNMEAALRSGQVDAIFVVEPFVTAALAAGARVLSSVYAEAAPNLTVAVYFAAKQLIAGNPDLVNRFAEAMKESLAYADAHGDEVRAVLTTYTQIKGDQAAKLILPKFPPDVNKESVQTLADLAKRDGVLTKDVNVDDLLPSS
jgi:NitT/TauT family transport system substrate-binding protein